MNVQEEQPETWSVVMQSPREIDDDRENIMKQDVEPVLAFSRLAWFMVI